MVRYAPKRNREKEAFWRQAIQRQGSSGLTVRTWCRQHSLKQDLFYWWRRELARRAAEQEPASFAAVRVRADDPAAEESRLEIVLAGGRSIRLYGRVDRQMLGDVLAVVTSASSVEPEGGSC